MAPRGVSNWRRPYTSIYNDNYRYGTGLYSDTLSGIEKRYSESLSKTQLRADRPDLAFTTFAGSSLTSSANLSARDTTASKESPLARQISIRETISKETPLTRQISIPQSPVKDPFRNATFESRLNTALHSSYALDDEVVESSSSRKQNQSRNTEQTRPTSLYDDACFWTLPTKTENPSPDIFRSSSRRKIGGKVTPTNGPTAEIWKEKSRELQSQVESLEKSMSDSNNKLNNELSSLKTRYHSDTNELNAAVEQSSQQAIELQKTVKRQSNQLMDLQSSYDDVQRNLQNTLEEMGTWQSRCKTLKKDMDRLRDEVEQATLRKSTKM